MTGNDRACRQIKELQMGGKAICKPGDIATALNKYFVDSVTTLAQTQSSQQQIFIPKLVNAATPVFDLCEISQTQVERVICDLKSSKAKDFFGLDVKFLEQCKTSLTVPLTAIIKSSMN